jgi:uncharacterized OsmC-like protein
MEFPWQIVAPLGTLLIGLMGAMAVWIGRIVRAENASTAVVKVETDLAQLRRDYENNRVEAARTYVTTTTLIEVEQRLTSALNRLADQIASSLKGSG